MFLPCAAWLVIQASASVADPPRASARRPGVDGVALDLGHLVALLVGHHGVQVHVRKGTFFMKCSPAIIMRATQKKRMS